jgi:hypothetical protein
MIEKTIMGEDGTPAIEVKADGIFGAQAAIAHSGGRGNGPLMEQWIRSAGGRRWELTLQ